MEPIHVLGNSPIRCLAVSKLPLDNQEHVLDLASDRCLPVFDLAFPVNPLIVLGHIQFGRLPADPERDFGKALVIPNVWTLLDADVHVNVRRTLSFMRRYAFYMI